MYTILRTQEFAHWLNGLGDAVAKARVLARIDAASVGHFGVCAAVGSGVSEMKIDVGPGYRVYFYRQASIVYVLLCGGDKSSQKRDIARAKRMASMLSGPVRSKDDSN